MTRKIIVLDIESSGLDVNTAAILEIAAIDIESGEEFRAVPHVTQAFMSKAEPDALRVNKYYERGVYKDALETPEANKNIYDWLKTMLTGNTLAGSNPTFDAALLSRAITSEGPFGTPWHHRLFDLSAYAAGVLGLDELPGMAKVCELLDIVNEEPHSALGDARATAQCFAKLRGFAEQNRAR